MIQTILIVLVAVVVLIVIIAVLDLRYLRADDSDTFDDIPDEPRPARRTAEQDRERPPAPPERRPRQPEPVTEMWAADRPARTPDARVPSGLRDRDAGPRRTGPQRVASQAPARREPASSRPMRAAARPDGPDAATSSWDSLSDVDYWAELAADNKSEVTAAAGPAPAGRHGSEPVSDIRPAGGRPGGRGDSGHLPVRKRHQPSRSSQPSQPSQPSRLAGAPSARPTDAGQTEQIDLRAAQAATGRYNGDIAASSPDVLGRHGQPRPAAGHRPDAPPTQQQQRPSGAQRSAGPRQSPSAPPTPAAQPAYQPRPPAPAAIPAANGRGHGRADDDPLTSPSFPAVGTSDSRSYRTRRSSGASQHNSGQHQRPAADPPTPGHQYIDYSSAPRRTASQPDGYPAEPAGAAQASGRHSPAAPAANPYGSYVSEPQPAYSETARPSAGYQSAGYPEPPAPSLAAATYGGYAAGQQAASAGRYAAPAIPAGNSQPAAQPLGPPVDGYLPAAGLGGTGLGGGSHALNGSQASGYQGIDYSSIRYDDPVYPDGTGALPGYGSAGQHAAPRDQQDYRAGAGQDGYRGHPGYGTGGR